MRKLAWFSAAFALAAALYVYWLSHTAALWFAAGFLVLALLGKVLSARRIAILSLGLAIGLTWCSLYSHLWLQDIFALDGKTQLLSVTAADFSYDTGYGTAVMCKFRGREAILYTDRTDLSVQPGDLLEGQITVKTGRGERGHQLEASRLHLYAKENLTVTKGKIPGAQKLRVLICRQVDRLYTGQTAALVKALLTGVRHEIRYATSNMLSVCGLSHAVAVSGMHVSILLTVIALLCGYQPKLMAVLGIPAVVVFAMMTGATPSVCRAAVMQILLLLSPLLRRERDGLTALGAAALCLLAEDPWCIASISFQLSFAAVAGLFLFSGPVQQKLMALRKHPGKVWKAFASGISATLGATLLTLPLTMYYFGVVSIVAPVMNLLVLWAVTGVFVLGFASCWFPPAAWLVRGLCQYILAFSNLAASVPFAAAYGENIPLLVLAVAGYLAVSAALLFRRIPLKWVACILMLCFCICTVFSHLQFMAKPWQLHVLDVGQGQCLVLRMDDYVAVIDCGGSDPKKAGEQAARTLHSAGVTKADALILTHFDDDHAGGAVQFLSRIKTQKVYVPGVRQDDALLREISARAQVCSVDTAVRLVLPGGELMLYPPVSEENANNAGLCILARAGECDILITGDLDSSAEKKLLEYWDLPKLEILVAGHHGARSSTSLELLSRLRPENVVISAGRDNPYGHPHAETLQRIGFCGSKVYRTDLSGKLVFTSERR